MTQSLVKCVTGLFQEITHAHVINAQSQSKGIDKHAHSVGNLQVAATTAHGTQIYLAVVGVARDDVGSSCQEQMGGCDTLLAAEGGRLVQVGRTNRFADEPLFVTLGQVSGYFAGTLTSLQLLSKESL